jgi:hypothetical protein
MVVAEMARPKGKRRANAPPSPSSIIANVSSLAFAMSSHAAEEIEHILFSGKSWRWLQTNAKKGSSCRVFVSAISLYPGREIRSVMEKLSPSALVLESRYRLLTPKLPLS